MKYYRNHLLSLLIALCSVFAGIAAQSIKTRSDHIALSASDTSAAVITPKLHSADILIQAVWHDPVSDTQKICGSLYLNKLMIQPFLYGKASPYPLSKAEYRIYAHRVNRETGAILETISPIADVITVKPVSLTQLKSKRSYAPFFLDKSHLTPREKKITLASASVLALSSLGVLVLLLKHFKHSRSNTSNSTPEKSKNKNDKDAPELSPTTTSLGTSAPSTVVNLFSFSDKEDKFIFGDLDRNTLTFSEEFKNAILNKQDPDAFLGLLKVCEIIDCRQKTLNKTEKDTLTSTQQREYEVFNILLCNIQAANEDFYNNVTEDFYQEATKLEDSYKLSAQKKIILGLDKYVKIHPTDKAVQDELAALKATYLAGFNNISPNLPHEEYVKLDPKSTQQDESYDKSMSNIFSQEEKPAPQLPAAAIEEPQSEQPPLPETTIDTSEQPQEPPTSPTLQTLAQPQIQVQEQEFTSLHDAIEKGSPAGVQRLIEQGADLNTEICDESAIAYAIRRNNTEIWQLLIDKWIEQNGEKATGTTPLHQATWHGGRTEIARYLLDKGFDINAKSDHGWAPLHSSAGWGDEKMVQLLIENKADVNIKDSKGQTPLHCALEVACCNEALAKYTSDGTAGYHAIIKLLVSNGADINAKDDNGITPLKCAQDGNTDFVQLLLDYGADIEAQDYAGRTPRSLL